MIFLLPFIFLFIFLNIKQILLMIEQMEEVRVNATLKRANNSLLDDLEDAWAVNPLRVNVTAAVPGASNDTVVEEAKIQKDFEPDWSVVLGTFQHYKDENFEEFLVVVRVPYFVRKMILSSSPTITIERLFQDDDYYYEIYNDYYEPEDKASAGGSYMQADGGQQKQIYQMLITSTTWMRTSEQRFRLGHTFTKDDYDGTPSKNTYYFTSPTVLAHRKIKEKWDTLILREFDNDGFVLVVKDLKRNLKAKRFYRRLVEP